MTALLIIISISLLFLFLVWFALKKSNKVASPLDIIIATVYVFTLVLFIIGMLIHSNPYYQAIDPVDGECYSPFSEQHILTLIFYFIAFNTALFLVWKRSKKLPPLTLILALIFIAIGIIFNLAILYQTFTHNTESISIYVSDTEHILFLFAPFVALIIGCSLIYKTITEQVDETLKKTYANRYLNSVQSFLVTRSRHPLWIIVLLFPVFFICTLLLILVGQDPDSIVKVFTETTTWKLSQQIHPPILDHKGHYLCTVAASGHPEIVKPLRLGQRNGRPIIVNRQLLIANAFEEMIQDFSPRVHHIIRKNYDLYGYNLSKKINTPKRSSITYLAMKPLEWVFLISLYLFCSKPELKINKQYAMSA
ncbi:MULTISPECIES: DUF6688 family protein [Cellulophaga]|uniref:Uncharacterized protein n=1 Tax=Cellulophaga algicola (strain DSM 14237 / IC166 / ACAM 630) TaxID=688270 RepID=E6XBB4_CELAD|nr:MULTISPECIES: DUF6688 family protein [Cellulophaga]ADV49978.1 hypothetical protein Celal_2693 [Cellulophaga algicola DSM 14237]